MGKNTFYITTPIFYASNKVTLGNCYPVVISDSIARFNKILGKEVYFLTGTDEHGAKVARSAQENNKYIMEHLDSVVENTKALWKKLGIEYNRFIRTTDEDHVEIAQKVFKTLFKRGYIYKSTYRGLYCLPCESFWTENQLVDGKCPDCGREVSMQEEEAYFFKLSQFSDRLLKLYHDNPNFLQPQSRVHEMVNNFIKPGLQDLCVSRTSVKWGIPVDFDPKHTIYVWIDALSNYISALGYGTKNDELFKKFWPADLHLIGKEIVRFHAIIWPAILMALEIPLPKQIYGHGWLLIGSQKLSKSKETEVKEVLDPRILVDRYGADALRYILVRDIPIGFDGVYSTENLLKRINSDLCNDYGNFVKRTFAMNQKYFSGVVPKCGYLNNEDKDFVKNVITARNNVLEYMKKYDVTKAIIEIFSIFNYGNRYIDATAPWVLQKNNDKRLASVIYNLLEAIKIGSVLLSAFLPEKPAKVLKAFDFSELVKVDQIKNFGMLKSGIKLGEMELLYPRLDVEKEIAELSKLV